MPDSGALFGQMTDPHTKGARAGQILQGFMPRVIRKLIVTEADLCTDRLYKHAVSLVIQTLLSKTQQGSNPRLVGGHTGARAELEEIAEEIGPLDPEEVGVVYEHLCGFKIDMTATKSWRLVPSVANQRNQGLFYTPNTIVRYIVEQTINALDIGDSSNYLDLKILDPAVGAGRFLAEVLDQLTLRILAEMDRGDKQLVHRVNNINKRFRQKAKEHGTGIEHDEEASVRTHILRNCLYGVDLDPIAVSIAQAVLITRVFGRKPAMPGIEPHIRVGNALMGEATRYPPFSSKDAWDRSHAAAYYGKQHVSDEHARVWSEEKGVFHWSIQFPEVFEVPRSGFHAVVGNPPYEILSAKESGIEERREDLAYIRQMFRTCQGKINTYRLMLERGLTLLRKEGALGFIVPATLLADSTSDKLRRMIMDNTTVLKTVIVPEKARAFKGVTQALLILITRNGGETRRIEPIFWEGRGPIPTKSRIEITRDLIEQTDFRIPSIRSPEELSFLKALLRHPPLRGNMDVPPVGLVHQGEINLTIHRQFITTERTNHQLIRGEHIMPLLVNHPCPGGRRLDWVSPDFLEWHAGRRRPSESGPSSSKALCPGRFRGIPWERDRVAIGRVVNMDTDRRLKAAVAPAGAFLGDMTNFISGLTVPIPYLLGLLNSRVLNRRIKLTSTNNYLSAAEIEALPVPRVTGEVSWAVARYLEEKFTRLMVDPANSISGWLERLEELFEPLAAHEEYLYASNMIEVVVQAIQAHAFSPAREHDESVSLWHLLDALVLNLYGVESYFEII